MLHDDFPIVAFLIWLFFLIANLALVGAVIWVAWHFISKYW